MYGVYDKNDDEMYVMPESKVWQFLSDNSKVFRTYNVVTDGETVKVIEDSAGPNGTLSEMSINDFFYGFEDEGWIIRPVKER